MSFIIYNDGEIGQGGHGVAQESSDKEVGLGLWAATKKKAVEHIASVIVLGGAGLVALAGTTMWAAFSKWTAAELPAGAVVAFAVECPKEGWTEYKEGWGRFIVGTVSQDGLQTLPKKFANDDRDVELTPKSLGTPGGEEMHFLTTPEMPTHSHNLFSVSESTDGDLLTSENFVKQSAWPGADPAYTLKAQNIPATLAKSSNAGEGKAHNNMPPFIALNFCKKS